MWIWPAWNMSGTWSITRLSSVSGMTDVLSPYIGARCRARSSDLIARAGLLNVIPGVVAIMSSRLLPLSLGVP